MGSVGISIHALREEGDIGCRVLVYAIIEFLSTPSARRATAAVAGRANTLGISIHALREEGDLAEIETGVQQSVFLSTPSARRATKPDGSSLKM